MSRAWPALSCFVWLAFACGESPPVGEMRDAGVDAALVTVDEPDISWLDPGAPPIAIAPCPEGWRTVTGTDVTTCEPYAEGGPLICARGEAHFPGTTGCGPLGDPCPAGDYAATLPSSGVILYVDASALPAGDGSLGAPFATLAEVSWDTLAEGTTVALAKGTYDGTLPLRAGIHVVGACAAETIVTGAIGTATGVITLAGPGPSTVVRNLTLADAPRAGVHVRSGGALVLEGVGIDRASEHGIVVEGTGTLVEVDGARVTETRPTGAAFGRGISVSVGARLEGARVVLLKNRDVGIFAADVGTEVVLTDAAVLDTLARLGEETNGRGISLQTGARIELSRALVADSRALGIYAGSASSVSLALVIVRDTQAQQGDGTAGRGLTIRDGATGSARRVLIDRSHDMGVFLSGSGSAATLEDVVVRATEGRFSDEAFGRGIEAQAGASVRGDRIVIAENRDVGLFATGEGTVAEFTDLLIRDTREQASDGRNGRGLDAESGARITASRAILTRNRAVAVYAGSLATLALTDVIVRETLSRAIDGAAGYAVNVQDGARLDAERVRIERSAEVGIFSYRADAMIVGRDVAVVEVVRSRCECAERVFGHGVVALSAAVSLVRFEVRAAATCGLLVASLPDGPGTSSLDVASGVVSDSAIGACVQVPGYDTSRLMPDVQYRSNGVNLDSTSLPVPEPIDPIGS